MKKRMFTLFLALIMTVSVFSGCGEDKAALTTGTSTEALSTETSKQVALFNETGFPIVNEPITLKAFAGRHASHADWSEMLLWKTYEKKTGIHIEWDLVDSANITEMRNVRLASGSYPDMFFQSQVSLTDLVTYGSQDVFVPLNSMIDKYAPNMLSIFTELPEVKKYITMPDSNIYSLPYVIDKDFDSMTTNLKFWVSDSWLTKLNMTQPETTEGFYQYLKAVKAADSSVIPYTAHSFKWILRSMKGAFGIGNRGYEHEFVDYDEATKNIRFAPVTDDWKSMLQYLNKLYSEKLLDQDIFNMDYTTYVAKGSESKYASFVGIGPVLFNLDGGYTGTTVLEGPSGDKFFSMYAPNTSNAGGFVITSANKYPEATLRWMDYFYGDEGALLFFMGEEGETYTKNADGTYKYVDAITKNPSGLNMDQSIGQYLCWPGGSYPGIIAKEYYSGSEVAPVALKATEVVKKYKPSEVWTAFSFTKDENVKMAALKGDIEKYVTEMASRFVAGDVPFSEWDQYVDTIKKMDLDGYMKIYGAAYQRYTSN